MRGNDLITMLLLCDREEEYVYIEQILGTDGYFIPLKFGDLRELINAINGSSKYKYHKDTRTIRDANNHAVMKVEHNDNGVYIRRHSPDFKLIVDCGDIIMVYHTDERIADSQKTCNEIRNRISKYRRAIITRALCYRQGPKTAARLRNHLDLCSAHFSACLWEVRSFSDDSTTKINEFFSVNIDDNQHLLDMFHLSVRLSEMQRYLVAGLFARL